MPVHIAGRKTPSNNLQPHFPATTYGTKCTHCDNGQARQKQKNGQALPRCRVFLAQYLRKRETARQLRKIKSQLSQYQYAPRIKPRAQQPIPGITLRTQHAVVDWPAKHEFSPQKHDQAAISNTDSHRKLRKVYKIV